MRELETWQARASRKPILLEGARQVGKTWLLREFGRRKFDNVAYISLDRPDQRAALFQHSFDIPAALPTLQALSRQNITPGRTLLILDEIQEHPPALTALKYFREQMPDLHVAASGSLLGLVDHVGSGFPVGNVQHLRLHPMSFGEYLRARGEEYLAELLVQGDLTQTAAVHQRCKNLLREYYIVGGMPAVVERFLENELFTDARSEQSDILADYTRDISKHLDEGELARVLQVWRAIPTQLAKEDRRFVFSTLSEGGRARTYLSALTWLQEAGLVSLVRQVSRPGIPLASYAKENLFKLFILDIGLLGALAGLSPMAILQGNPAFTHFKGAFAEQFVCQQLLTTLGGDLFYWSKQSSYEIDFLFQHQDQIFPVEVKAEENLRSKSLQAFAGAHPDSRPLRFSGSSGRIEDWMRSLPLYAAAFPTFWA